MRDLERAIVVVMLGALCVVAFGLDALLLRKMMELHMNDFGKFYYSARAFLDGADMYAPSPATNVGIGAAAPLQFLNMNPPHFHLIVLPFAALPPDQAAIFWIVGSLVALTVSIALIGGELVIVWTPIRVLLLVLGVLSFSGTQAFFLTGQVSMLLMLAMTVCWTLARHERWLAAAVWLGVCISVKPFVAIFVPYLLLTRRFRPVAVAVATAAAAFAVGYVVFGQQNLESWYRALAQSGDWTWAEMNASLLGFFRRAFDLQPIAPPLVVHPGWVNAWIPLAGLIGAATLIVAVADRSALAVDRAFALLLVAAILISPLGWIYYAPVVAGPVAALLVDERRALTRRWGSVLLGGVAVAGCFWPHPLLGVFQPNRWSTVLFTSAYFWGVLAAWGWLLTSGPYTMNKDPIAERGARMARRDD
jgi:alpha-1,2-mannosyltransferase